MFCGPLVYGEVRLRGEPAGRQSVSFFNCQVAKDKYGQKQIEPQSFLHKFFVDFAFLASWRLDAWKFF
jgi:hypothetical protein